MPEPRVVVFNANETMSDADAEKVELSEGTEQQQPASEQSAEQAQSETQQQPAADTEAPNKTGVVPYARFQEKVKETNEAKREAAELRERWARLEERQKVAREEREATQRQQEQAARAAERPDPTVDPIGAELWDLKEWKKNQEQVVSQLQQRFTEQVTGIQQNQETSEFNNWVQQQAQTFHSQNPHYYDVATHAANKRIEFWQALGAPPEVAKELVQKESFLVAAVARQFGGQFAPAIYKLGSDWGWQAPQAQTQNGNGAAPQNQQRLQQVKAGQAVQGLGRVPGAGGESQTNYRNMSFADLANISEAEHTRLMADKGPAGKDYRAALARAEGVEEDYARL